MMEKRRGRERERERGGRAERKGRANRGAVVRCGWLCQAHSRLQTISLAGLRRSHRCPAVPQYSNPELLDGLWLDCMGVLGFQSHDACGGNVRGLMFNVSGDRRYETSGYVDGQRTMVARIRAEIAGKILTEI